MKLKRECCADTLRPDGEYQPYQRWPDTMPRNVREPLEQYSACGQSSNNVCTAYPSHTVITMPALSPTMTAGNIGTWQKKPGDVLAPGDVLVEIETDKAQMDFEFQEDGVLAKVLKDSGEKDIAVGNVSPHTAG
jgi:biotin carboxyl carrier protein